MIICLGPKDFLLVKVRQDEEGKPYHMEYIIFPSVACFNDFATELVEQTPIMRLHTMYFDLISCSKGYERGELKDDGGKRELK